jgi:hypothetical protein
MPVIKQNQEVVEPYTATAKAGESPHSYPVLKLPTIS